MLGQLTSTPRGRAFSDLRRPSVQGAVVTAPVPPFRLQERELELQKEQRRQEENDKLRQEFAQHANAFHQWIQETRCGPAPGARWA